MFSEVRSTICSSILCVAGKEPFVLHLLQIFSYIVLYNKIDNAARVVSILVPSVVVF